MVLVLKVYERVRGGWKSVSVVGCSGWVGGSGDWVSVCLLLLSRQDFVSRNSFSSSTKSSSSLCLAIVLVVALKVVVLCV